MSHFYVHEDADPVDWIFWKCVFSMIIHIVGVDSDDNNNIYHINNNVETFKGSVQ